MILHRFTNKMMIPVPRELFIVSNKQNIVKLVLMNCKQWKNGIKQNENRGMDRYHVSLLPYR